MALFSLVVNSGGRIPAYSNLFCRGWRRYVPEVDVWRVRHIRVILSRQVASVIGSFMATFLPLLGTVRLWFQPDYFRWCPIWEEVHNEERKREARKKRVESSSKMWESARFPICTTVKNSQATRVAWKIVMSPLRVFASLLNMSTCAVPTLQNESDSNDFGDVIRFETGLWYFFSPWTKAENPKVYWGHRPVLSWQINDLFAVHHVIMATH